MEKQSCENCIYHKTIKDDNNELWIYCQKHERGTIPDDLCLNWIEDKDGD